MRIASLTKPITSMAILMLVEGGKLKLSDQVFGDKSIFGLDLGEPSFDGKGAAVTVKQLLSHTASGWGNTGSDPMFLYMDLDGNDLIRKVLDTHRLDRKPGTQFNYSNFGYYVLGRIIERESGLSYEEYVRRNILEPLRIQGMRIGAQEPGPDETRYYSVNDMDPRRLRPSHMDAHGGWIANTVELLKILSAIDGFPKGTPLLKPGSVAAMTSPALASSNYALGLCVNKYDNWWHTGSLPGATSELGRAAGGFCWAILVNTRPDRSIQGAYFKDLDELFWKLKDSISSWPRGSSLLEE